MEKEFGCFHLIKKKCNTENNQILKRKAKVMDLRQTTGMLRIEKERGFQMLCFLVQTLDRKKNQLKLKRGKRSTAPTSASSQELWPRDGRGGSATAPSSGETIQDNQTGPNPGPKLRLKAQP